MLNREKLKSIIEYHARTDRLRSQINLMNENVELETRWRFCNARCFRLQLARLEACWGGVPQLNASTENNGDLTYITFIT